MRFRCALLAKERPRAAGSFFCPDPDPLKSKTQPLDALLIDDTG